ncbi:MAG: adenosylcobinamide-GDP ribazoletransferase [Pseudorhodobacter sp.]|nr:adenosylcobinamide-GDP ribazoletransferase [Pseudorhodobacter sp.]
MTTNDSLQRIVPDIRAALGLLTRLPLPTGPQLARGAATAWAWPLAGAVVGALAATAATLALAIGLTPGVAAALVLATQAMLTGAMHEDGLADAADGLWGGWDKARRLAIMKDSHIGSYGVMALVLCSLGRWSALTVVLTMAGHWPVLIAVGALSRVPMAVIMATLPNARGAGLAHAVGRPDARTAGLAAALGCGLALGLMGGTALGMAGLAAVACLGLALIAKVRIGGQTGDILGASQQLAEVAALAIAAAALV